MAIMDLFIKKGINGKNDTEIGLNLDIITATSANWYLLYSGKGTGKSWATRQRALNKFNEFKDEFVIVKRLDSDCKPSLIRKYFDSVDVETITNGVYNSIEVKGNEIFFAFTDDKFKVHKGVRIGHVIPLNLFERFKGTDYPKVSTIIFEEFISEKGLYLGNESSTLMKLINTIYRPQTKAEFETMTEEQKERKTRQEVWLCGNTISRNCPYFNDWYLKNIIQQESNTIDIYTYKYPEEIDDLTGKERVVNLACWYIGESEGNKKKSHGFVFGKSFDTIVKGVWECDIYPKLIGSYDEYEKIFELLIKSDSVNYCLQLLEHKKTEEYTLYCYPSTSGRKIERVISKEYSLNFLQNNKLLRTRKVEEFIMSLLVLNKICFSDNLTGTEFNSFKDKLISGF